MAQGDIQVVLHLFIDRLIFSKLEPMLYLIISGNIPNYVNINGNQSYLLHFTLTQHIKLDMEAKFVSTITLDYHRS